MIVEGCKSIFNTEIRSNRETQSFDFQKNFLRVTQILSYSVLKLLTFELKAVS